jgi:hypothetical protein
VTVTAYHKLTAIEVKNSRAQVTLSRRGALSANDREIEVQHCFADSELRVQGNGRIIAAVGV